MMIAPNTDVDVARASRAIQNIRAFSVYCAGKLPQHISDDLRIVANLAASAIEAASAGETRSGSTEGESAVGAAETPKDDSAAIAQNPPETSDG